MSSTGEIACNHGETVVDWRHLDFYRDVVSQDLGLPEDEFCLRNLSVTNATDGQSGFTSLLHRVLVDVELKNGECEQKSYIVKENSNDAIGGNEEENYALFEKEIEVFQKLIPEFEKLFQYKVKFGPRFYKAVKSPSTVIVMEDLNASGYIMRSSSNRLNLSDSRAVLSRLAKFHAASAVYTKQNEAYSKFFGSGMFDGDTAGAAEVYLENLKKSFVTSLRERNCSNEFLDLISQWNKNLYVVGAELFRLNDNDFNVLNHGDLWMNNLMFGESDLMMIDFQIAFYGSFSFDLLQFILCTVEVDEIINKFDELVEFYWQELQDAFQILYHSSLLPSLENLKADVDRHGFFAAILLVEAIPLMSYMTVGQLNMDLMSSPELKGEEFRRKLYHNDKFVDVVDQLLPFLFERGYLKCPMIKYI
ncbi:uncharacterized protein LOC109412327 isoform X1 [Aedes albopictus]|uniref:CHK kinase-like domain-containing protein n=1 Tax=Aedes albopictus TaxID=7160 RepID=A0ABM1Z3E1_AEDAL